MENLYSTLGVASDATPEEIKDAYRNLSKEFHPDHNPEGESEFIKIKEAYETLSDPKKRKYYDQHGKVRDDGYGEDAEIKNFVCNMLFNISENCVGQDVDVIKEMNKRIHHNIKHLDSNIKHLQAIIKHYNKRVIPKISRKSGKQNILVQMMESRVIDLTETINSEMRTKERLKKILAFINDYIYILHEMIENNAG